MTKEDIQDFTLRITSANKTEMIVILYDICITYLRDSLTDLKGENVADFRTNIGRCKNTIQELINSLDTSTEMGQNLLSLYIFCSGELTKAFLDCDSGCIYHVISIFQRLRDAYAAISKQDDSKAVMENTERVYSGYTYNRSMKSENLYDRDENRGFLV